MTSSSISLCYPILFSFSLSFLLPSVINIFKNNFHSLITFTTPHHPTRSLPGLATATEEPDSLPNVLQSVTLKPNNGNSLPPLKSIMSCTESLGFESSGVVDHKMDMIIHNDDSIQDELWRRRLMTRRAESRRIWRKERSFPPPLSSLNRNGKPTFYLRPVRKDGRLELTEVRIHRPEILHASRHDGRLTLHLIPDQDEEEEEEEELVVVEEEEEKNGEREREDEDDRVKEWGYGVPGSGGVGSSNSNEGELRRCHEMVNQQQQHHHHHHAHANHLRIGIV